MVWTLLLTMAWAQSSVGTEGALNDGIEAVDTGLWVDEDRMNLDPVVGGTPVGPNDWDDTVGIVMRGSYVGCTGTLIHPKVVLTAAHCLGGITSVAIGSKNWADEIPELIDVAEVHEYPNSQSSFDVAVLVLEQRSKFEPRAVGIECTVDDYLVDGAEVAVVGFGATRESGNGSTSVLHEGVTYVQDADGDANYVDVNGERIYTGFNGSVSPGGEVGAGGNGVDACFGDSGGPLYLKTDDGHVLVGVTSRAYAGVPSNRPCAYGGIYARPDALIDWIEEVSGKTVTYSKSCNEPPELMVDDMIVFGNAAVTTPLQVIDPEGREDKARFAIVEQPLHGAARITEAGELEYTPENGFVGEDSLVVAVTDKGFPRYPRTGADQTVEQTVTVRVMALDWLSEAGEVGAVLASGGCACASGGSSVSLPSTAAWLSMGLFAAWRRRRVQG